MATARSLLIDPAKPGTHHLLARCVRRGFLCGGAYEHRRQWVEDGIRLAAETFAVDVLALAVMSNHCHLIVHVDPERAATWTAREITERWATLFPDQDPESGEAMPWEPAMIDQHAANADWVAIRRERLASISWMMRILLQRIARRANREDGVTGHFWEGRFTSVPLLDQAAVIACMVYNDLNPIRAKIADTPEASDHTSIQMRIEARQEHRKATTLLAQAQHQSIEPEQLAWAQQRATAGPEAGLWIAPFQAAQLHPQVPGITLDEYIELVDATGRLIVAGKRGSIPAHLHHILERLQIDVDRWIEVMIGRGAFLGRAVGNLVRLTAEAAKRGMAWIVDKTRIHAERRRTATT